MRKSIVITVFALLSGMMSSSQAAPTPYTEMRSIHADFRVLAQELQEPITLLVKTIQKIELNIAQRELLKTGQKQRKSLGKNRLNHPPA